MRAAIPLAEHLTLARTTRQRHHFDHAVGQLERRLDGIGEASAIVGFQHQPVDDHAHVVIHASIQLGRIGKFDHIAVNPCANKPLFARRFEQLAEFAFAAAHQWSKHFQLGAGIAQQNDISDLGRALTLHGT